MRKLLWTAFLILVWPQIERKIEEMLRSKTTKPKARKATGGRKRSRART